MAVTRASTGACMYREQVSHHSSFAMLGHRQQHQNESIETQEKRALCHCGTRFMHVVYVRTATKKCSFLHAAAVVDTLWSALFHRPGYSGTTSTQLVCLAVCVTWGVLSWEEGFLGREESSRGDVIIPCKTDFRTSRRSLPEQ